MGLIITELKERKPDLPYFDDNFTGEYPAEAPLQYQNLRKFIHVPAANQKKMPNIRNRLRMPHIFYRTVTEDTQPSGNTLSMCRLLI